MGTILPDLASQSPQGTPQSVDTAAQYIGQNGLAPAYTPGSNVNPAQEGPNTPSSPTKTGLRAVLAGMMTRFSYGAGQAMKKDAGLPTDDELANSAAQRAHLNAQTQLTQSQAEKIPVDIGNGQLVYLPPAAAAQIVKQRLANTGKTDVATINKDARTESATITATSKVLSPKENENAWIAVTNDPNADPQAKAQAKSKLDQLQARRVQLQYAKGAAFAKSKAENTPFATFDSDGNVTTTTVADAIKNGYPSVSAWNTTFGPTGSTKSQAQAAGAVAEHIPDFEKSVQSLAAKGELGPVMGRLNAYLTQGYGGDDPDIANFVTTVGLLKSGAVRAHFGARGGQQVLQKFDSMLNTAQEPNALIGSAEAIKSFLNTYKSTGTPNPTRGTANLKPPTANTQSSPTTANDYLKKFQK